MSASRATNRRAASLALLLLALPGVVHGCSSPTAPADPPGGGRRIDLSFPLFEQNVSPVLVRHGCDAIPDCHGGGIRGTLQLSPPGAKDVRFDFDQVALQVSATAPDSSPILTEPLVGGTPHAFKPFASTADSGYQAIRAWIMDGVQR